jgi:hypothetical protein
MPTENVVAYEARVTDFVPTFQCTLLCVYEVSQLRPGMVADLLATHPTSIVDGRLRTNPLYMEPDAFLEKLRQRRAMQGKTTSL